MTSLIVFGLGYSARRYVADCHRRWRHIAGTVRDPARMQSMVADAPGCRVDILPFDGTSVTASLQAKVREADAVLVSIPPVGDRDPVLALLGGTLLEAPRLRAVVYLSTVGVYGDHDGAWVDEDTPPAPGSARSRARVAAECAWQAFGQRRNIPVALLRLAGIYGPGSNALVNLADGAAKRLIKPGQVFNRIHVADIAQAIDAAFAHKASGAFNVCDNEPAPPQDVVGFAAELMGVTPPPSVSFDSARASLSPMALTFYGENKRVRNARLTHELGVTLRYPTYREGLTALWEAGEARVSRAAGK